MLSIGQRRDRNAFSSAIAIIVVLHHVALNLRHSSSQTRQSSALRGG